MGASWCCDRKDCGLKYIGGNASDLELPLQAFVFPFDTHWAQQESCRKTRSDGANIKHYNLLGHTHTS